MDEKYTVYKHTSPSGKAYIGITKLKVKKRWNDGKGYEDCTLFNNAICKYGWENIKHEIVADGLEKSEACNLEIRLIKKYKEAGKSYNCSTGGELTALGCKRSAEFKKRLSEANKGKTLSNETKKKLSESHKGKKIAVTDKVIEGRAKAAAAMRGKPKSEEHKRKISEAKRGKYTGADNKRSIDVLCMTNGIIYHGVSEAARELKIDASSVSKVCKGKLKHYKGFAFKYASDCI